ncbi:MAG: hypothetical protein ACXAD7_02355 [Candidatus Kariarchaeaceae archaeon]
MTYTRIDHSIQAELGKYVKLVEIELLKRELEVPKSSIIGYLLEYLTTQLKGSQNLSLEAALGPTDKIVDIMIRRNNITWPTNPWHEGQIKIHTQMTIKATTSSTITRSILYLHLISLIPSIFLGLMSLLVFSLAILYDVTDGFRVLGFHEILFCYALFSIVMYPITTSISNNNQLRQGIADIEGWINQIKNASKMHFFSFCLFSIYLQIGSILQDETSSLDSDNTSINGYNWAEILIFIIVSTFIFILGLRRFWINANKPSKLSSISENPRFAQISLWGLRLILILCGIAVIMSINVGIIVLSSPTDYIIIGYNLPLFVGLGSLFTIDLYSIITVKYLHACSVEFQTSWKKSLLRYNRLIALLLIAYACLPFLYMLLSSQNSSQVLVNGLEFSNTTIELLLIVFIIILGLQISIQRMIKLSGISD